MAKEFISDTTPEFTTAQPEPTLVRIAITSSPQGLNNTIHTLYHLGFAEVNEWSQPQPTQKVGEVISVLHRRLLLR